MYTPFPLSPSPPPRRACRYATTLRKIHARGRAAELNKHFRPQNTMGCDGGHVTTIAKCAAAHDARASHTHTCPCTRNAHALQRYDPLSLLLACNALASPPVAARARARHRFNAVAPTIAHKFGLHETSVGQTHATKKDNGWPGHSAATPAPSLQPDSDENVQVIIHPPNTPPPATLPDSVPSILALAHALPL